MDTEIYAATPEPTTDAKTPSNPAEDEAREAEADAEIVQRAKDCYRVGVDTSSRWRADALEDLEFLAGDQWDANIRGQRDAQGRPALTINRLPQFVRQVTNEQRQSRPSVTVNPVDSESDIRTADVLQGIVRNIEYTSNADAAYASGGQAAAITGLGYWDVRAEYEDERSFEQRLTIGRIRNSLSVVMDPGAKELAGDDARWVSISTDISKSEWKATYPDKEIPVGGDWGGAGDASDDWVAKDGVRIHEYRYITEDPDTLIDISQADQVLVGALKMAKVDVSTGAILESEVGGAFAQKLKDAKLPTRPSTKRRARWVKIAGDQIIERGELAGRYLQLVRVVGTELDVNGKVIFEGVIRHAKDAQRVLNYSVSAETEAIALTPKAPFIAAEGQIEGYEEQWKTANQRPLSVLPYKPTSIAGVPVPMPQRVMAEANISAITTSRQMAAEDLNAVTGIYPTQFGAPAPEQSGRAILARQNQGHTTNFHFADNFAMAVRYTGRILVDLIPKFYSGPRILRILGEDGQQEMVPVNGAPGEFRGESAIDPQTGKPVIQLDAGRYDVAVSMGPSYLSRRQEAAAQMLELIKVNPQLSGMIGDLLVQSMDIPGGSAIADRLRKMLPPEIRPPDDKQPPPQVLAQRLQQSQQMMQQMTQQLHVMSELLESKTVDNRSKERIALINAQVELTKTAATLNSKEAMAMLEHGASIIQKRLELDGINEPDAPPMDAPQPQPPMNGSPPQQQPTQPMPGGAPNAG